MVIDIGTAAVSAGIVETPPHHLPVLSRVEQVPLGSGSETSKDTLVGRLEEAVKTLLEKYVKEHTTRVRVVVAAPWHTARIKTIVQSIEKQTTISEKTVTKSLERYRAEAPPASGNVDAEALAVQVKVNGYNTALVHPVVGSTLEINYYESELNASIAQKISGLVERAFPHASITFHTFPLVASVALRSLSEETSFVVVDVAGEMTEVSVMYEDALHHLSSFPTGYYTLARAVAEKEGSVSDSLSRFSLYARNELAPGDQEVVQKKITTAFEGWGVDFKEALEHASDSVPLPKTLFLLSDRDILPWVRKGIEGQNIFSFDITPVTPALIQKSLDITDTGSYDMFLALEALFFHTYRTSLIGER